ncbi:MAG: type II toxin-antitoxin system RatA family toxin [Syntrophobacteraceae bacterium]
MLPACPMTERGSSLIRALAFLLPALSLALSGCAKPALPQGLQHLAYPGRTNEHHIVIEAPPERIFSILTDFDRFPGLVPSDRIRVSKQTGGPYGVGTVIRTETGYKIKVSWTTRVVDFQECRKITLQFQEGMFRGGYEIWDLEPDGEKTRVSHTILFNLSNFIYRILWVLKDVESKHNILVEATLHNLKRASEADTDGHQARIDTDKASTDPYPPLRLAEALP